MGVLRPRQSGRDEHAFQCYERKHLIHILLNLARCLNFGFRQESVRRSLILLCSCKILRSTSSLGRILKQIPKKYYHGYLRLSMLRFHSSPRNSLGNTSRTPWLELFRSSQVEVLRSFSQSHLVYHQRTLFITQSCPMINLTEVIIMTPLSKNLVLI